MKDAYKKILFSIGILLTVVVLMVALKDLARRTIAVPIMYLVWAAGLAFRIFSQHVLWILFLGVGMFILIKSLLNPKSSDREKRKIRTRYPGRIEELAKLVCYANRWNYSRWTLAHYLAELGSDILAFHAQNNPRQIQAQLKEGILEVSPEIQTYFQFGLSRNLTQHKGWFARIRERFTLREHNSDPTISVDPEPVVTFLEHQLETSYDNDKN
jgi:hypothetical protein